MSITNMIMRYVNIKVYSHFRLNGYLKVVSNWVRYPVFVIARDPERFHQSHMKQVVEKLNFLPILDKLLCIIYFRYFNS